MQIHLDTSTASTGELTALIALLASLGGRLPSKGIGEVHADIRPTLGAATARPLPLPSEQLLADAAASRVAPPPADEEPSEPVDPASLDAEGLPWDERIHSSNKARNADNTWRKRRGVDEVTYGRVHAELQAAQADGAADEGNPATGTPSNSEASQAGDSVPTAVAAPPPPPPVEAGNAPAAPSAPTADAPPAPPPAASASGAGRFDGFPAFVQAVGAVRVPAIPYLELNTYAQTLGVTGGFKDMKDKPELWEDFYALAGGQ